MKFLVMLCIFFSLNGICRAQGFIAVVGDSLSVGLEGGIKVLAPHVIIKGYGVVSSGLSRTVPVDWQLRIREVVNTHPSGIFILIGMNDMDGKPNRNYMMSMIEFLNPVRESGIPYFVMSVPETDEATRNVNIGILNSYMSVLVPRMGGIFLMMPSFPRTYRTSDGIHFTPDGYRRMAMVVLNSVRCRQTECQR